jgi:aromatic ring-cleaving dioxygenase
MKKTYNFKFNSQIIPENFPREFDAHIYFESIDLLEATNLRDKIKNTFNNHTFFVGDMCTEPIGPHPMPMFEANFPQECFAEVVLWLMRERKNFSVLVHPLTGDDLYDHTQGAIWLGSSVELKYDILR